jgi:hypothetical protein
MLSRVAGDGLREPDSHEQNRDRDKNGIFGNKKAPTRILSEPARLYDIDFSLS